MGDGTVMRMKPAVEPRAAARRKIFQPGEMEWGAGRYRVHLLDLSRGGALVYADHAPEAGAVVRLACAGHALGTARVMWANGKRFGVMFSAPIGETTVTAMIDAQQAARRDPNGVIR